MPISASFTKLPCSSNSGKFFKNDFFNFSNISENSLAESIFSTGISTSSRNKL